MIFRWILIPCREPRSSASSFILFASFPREGCKLFRVYTKWHKDPSHPILPVGKDRRRLDVNLGTHNKYRSNTFIWYFIHYHSQNGYNLSNQTFNHITHTQTTHLSHFLSYTTHFVGNQGSPTTPPSLHVANKKLI